MTAKADSGRSLTLRDKDAGRCGARVVAIRKHDHSGNFAAKGTIADRIHTGFWAQEDLEEELCEWWPDLGHISSDHYDNSLEVYFEENSPTDNEGTLEPTEEQLAEIWTTGFDRMWINFKKYKDGVRTTDGFDKHYVNPDVAKRWATYQATLAKQ